MGKAEREREREREREGEREREMVASIFCLPGIVWLLLLCCSSSRCHWLVCRV